MSEMKLELDLSKIKIFVSNSIKEEESIESKSLRSLNSSDE